MPTAPAASASLSDWLDYISAVNPREIELGLERVARVWQLMGGGQPGRNVITVAGTNGKGTCVAALEHLLHKAGYSVGCYTSPHLFRYNERIRIDAEEVEDARLCTAFAQIDAARGEILLSYFEFSTLAALTLFRDADVDTAVLEVGLGGRLDAVNIIDPDVAVITSISLDHTDWLGPDIEVIGREKAGIMRAGKPVVCADPAPPQSIGERAGELGAILYALGTHFSVAIDQQARTWQASVSDTSGARSQLPTVGLSMLRPDNLAAALQALFLIARLDVRHVTGLAALTVTGRLQRCRHRDSGRRLLLDVAHNPAAVTNLVAHLSDYRQQHPESRIAVVMAVMADKDVESMTTALQTAVHIWYIAQVDMARCMPAAEVAHFVKRQGGEIAGCYPAVISALEAALTATAEHDLIVVTGSFYTVAELDGLFEPL